MLDLILKFEIVFDSMKELSFLISYVLSSLSSQYLYNKYKSSKNFNEKMNPGIMNL